MKNAIQYYYNLIPNDIRQSKKSYFFQIGDQKFYLTFCERNLSDINILYEISLQLFQRGIYCHQFVFNRMNELVTVINQVPYVLFQYYVDDQAKVSMQDILFFSNITLQLTDDLLLKRNQWKDLWIAKNDYFEYQVSEFGKQFPVIRESFSYYLGMSEIAIMLLSNVPKEMFSRVVLSHRRVMMDDTLLEFYNPLNFILDIRVRDIAEYFKAHICADGITIQEIQMYVYQFQYSPYELLLLFIRLLYPSYYYDRYERIMEDKESEKILEEIIDRIPQYEEFLKEMYYFVKQYIHIDTILWLEKK